MKSSMIIPVSLWIALLLMLLNCRAQNLNSMMNQESELESRDQDNAIISWLAELPEDNVQYPLYDTFSHSGWIEKGRKIPDLEDSLIKMLAEQDGRVDLTDVAYALGWFGSEKSVPLLLTSLKSNNISLRIESVAALGKIGDPDSFGPLQDLFRDEDENIRANVCIAIGHLCHEKSKEFLTQALNDKSSFVIDCAKEGLKILENECHFND